ncbi:hypothetical protein T484DRAFT_3333735 [Baffinella frigidus]|nr:hypothetical protein T484DRAFT_3333735 [Cryptophyta sp. CCMP2293]
MIGWRVSISSAFASPVVILSPAHWGLGFRVSSYYPRGATVQGFIILPPVDYGLGGLGFYGFTVFWFVVYGSGCEGGAF